jgi:hypothetical protein
MVSNCANPNCAKPLHYLREGRIFVFDVAAAGSAPGGKRLRRIEHYWLCGECSQTMTVVSSTEGVRVVARPRTRRVAEAGMYGSAAAS